MALFTLAITKSDFQNKNFVDWLSLCVATYILYMEIFTELKIHGFNPTEVFADIFSHCLGQKCLLFSINKERRLYSQNNFSGILENCEKCEWLAQRIFLCLLYVVS